VDTDGDHGADGILGPYREKEGSYYTVKEIWAPIVFEHKEITSAFDGTLALENRFFFTNLNHCRFTWSWPVSLPEKVAHEIIPDKGSHTPELKETDSLYIVTANNIQISFNRKTGLLLEVKNTKGIIPFGNGPYPVWKNRMKGTRLSIWVKDYLVQNPRCRKIWDPWGKKTCFTLMGIPVARK
jgi:hypothetical protein